MQNTRNSVQTQRSTQSRTTRGVAIAAAVLLVGVAVFQAAVAVGAPLGDYVWGGYAEGDLPAMLRVASGLAAVSLVWMALVVLARGGIELPVTPVPARHLRTVTWVIAGFLAVNTLGNVASRSSAEQLVFAPVTAILVVLVGFVALRSGDARS